MANTMQEKPLFKKCCFCIPLRLCLQTWTFVKVVADIAAIIYLVILTAVYCSREHDGYFNELAIYHVLAVLVVMLLIDFGFQSTFLVGVCVKSLKILSVFYSYELFTITTKLTASIVCFKNSESFYAMIVILFILLDIATIITIKSEMVKLRNKAQCFQLPCNTDIERTGQFIPEE